ncbi:MAG: type IV pilus modification PilV family protein [Armatimonadota bacterium]
MLSKRRGFTLVEMLVSILILAIGLVGGSLCLSLALTCNLRANRIALATEKAQSEIESQRSEGDLQEKHESIDDPLLPNGYLDADLGTRNENDNTQPLSVEVSWNGKNRQRESVKLETIVYIREKHMATGEI